MGVRGGEGGGGCGGGGGRQTDRFILKYSRLYWDSLPKLPFKASKNSSNNKRKKVRKKEKAIEDMLSHTLNNGYDTLVLAVVTVASIEPGHNPSRVLAQKGSIVMTASYTPGKLPRRNTNLPLQSRGITPAKKDPHATIGSNT